MMLKTKRYGIEWLVFGLVFTAIFSTVTFATNPASTGNVEQWINLTNELFYGKQDFLFSYGPLYWLTGAGASTYNSISYWGSAVFISAVQAVFWAMLFSLSFRGRGYLLLALAYFLFFKSLIAPSAYFLWPLLVVAYLEFSQPAAIKPGTRQLVILGLLAGFSFYVRFFYGMFAVATFGSYFLSRVITQKSLRELLLVAVGTVVGYIAFGIAIFHQLTHLITYAIINSQLSFGNSVDMTIDVRNTRETFAAVALIWLFLNIFAVRRRFALFLTVNALFLLLLKLGFSRTDHYLGYFVAPVAAFACITLFDGSRQGKLLCLGIFAALYYISVNPTYPGAVTMDALAQGVDFSKSYTQRMADAYAPFKLPRSIVQTIGKSSIDVYPYNNEYAFGNKLNYVHRPSFQNYMTLTPKLDEMNQKFFEGPHRPEFVLWTSAIGCAGENCNPFIDLDGKLALNEDPLTVSAVLMNYHVVETFVGRDDMPAALLKKNAMETPYSEHIVASQTMTLGQWYPVPNQSSGVLRLKPHLKFTLAGRIRNLLFRGGVLNIRYKLESGDIHQFRANILNSSSGIWISPLLSNFDLTGPRVESVMLTSSSGDYFKPDFAADWAVVPIEGANTAQVSFDRAQAASCDGSLDAINGQGPVPSPIKASGTLKLNGWLTMSGKYGIPFNRTIISLTDSKGDRRLIETKESSRPDVAAVYNQADLGMTGFEGEIDTTGLHGDYRVGIAGFYDGRTFACKKFDFQLSVP